MLLRCPNIFILFFFLFPYLRMTVVFIPLFEAGATAAADKFLGEEVSRVFFVLMLTQRHPRGKGGVAVMSPEMRHRLFHYHGTHKAFPAPRRRDGNLGVVSWLFQRHVAFVTTTSIVIIFQSPRQRRLAVSCSPSTTQACKTSLSEGFLSFPSMLTSPWSVDEHHLSQSAPLMA